MDDPLVILGLLLIGGAFGFALGKMKAAEILGPMIHKMSEKIQVLESELIRKVLADDFEAQVEGISEENKIQILEHWNDLRQP